MAKINLCGSWVAAIALALSALSALSGCPLKTGSSSSTMPSGGGSSNSGGGGESAPSGSSTLTVPNLVGKTMDEAKDIVKAAGFSAEVESSKPVECENAPQDPGKINCQDPEAGKVVQRYAMIQVNVYTPQTFSGSIIRSQLATLHGLSPDQAKAALKKMGHDGAVKIGEITDSGGGHAFNKACGENKVCSTSGESGIGLHDDITLYINPKLSIALPPD
jgi:hypothetical protein